MSYTPKKNTKTISINNKYVGIVNKMYERYVDDINKYMETPVGARYNGGELVCTEEAKMEDEGIPADKRTFEIV